MASVKMATVTYVKGHSTLGHRRRTVTLRAHPTHLSLETAGTTLLAILWPDLRKTRLGVADKGIAAQLLSATIGLIPPFCFTPLESASTWGFWLTFWDDEVVRDQSIFLATGSKVRAERIAEALWGFRDRFMSDFGAAGGIEYR